MVILEYLVLAILTGLIAWDRWRAREAEMDAVIEREEMRKEFIELTNSYTKELKEFYNPKPIIPEMPATPEQSIDGFLRSMSNNPESTEMAALAEEEETILSHEVLTEEDGDRLDAIAKAREKAGVKNG